ncbi:hypothetical protein C8Q75DRAFT_716422 [Abortiporus biennis]|nr:hypothetical protein C8Q75DRAFT_716422 [Abortiporus biennis]
MECPLLVWMLSCNREMTPDEYDRCYRTMQTCVPHANVEYAPQSIDSCAKMVSYMLPLLMMRHRRIPRSKWRDNITSHGKRWIEQDTDSAMNPTHRLRAMIGYHLAYDRSLVGMVMTQGRQREVINIGLGIKLLNPPPVTTAITAYVESQYHKLTPLEVSFVSPREHAEDVALRRLLILIALKSAYLSAIGQPIGFDYSRLEFDFPNSKASGDGHDLLGWEFRIWQSNLGVIRGGTRVDETYQCACAFFRGTEDTKFIWQKEAKELESWVQFLNIDQLINVLPKLTD